MASPATTHPIHLAPLHPSELAERSASYKSSVNDTSAPPSTRSRRTLTWERFEEVALMAVPLVLHGTGLVFLIAALFQTGIPYMSVKQVGGTGRIDYSILGSCVTAVNSTASRICTSPTAFVDFMPSLTAVSSSMPGYAPLKLPFKSHQTPVIFISAIVLSVAALIIYIPLWILAYYPHAPILPAAVIKFIRYYSRQFFIASGVLSFTAMIISVTIGVGYKLLLMAARDDFNVWIQYSSWYNQIGNGVTRWDASIGDGFDLVWASSVFQALAALAINVSLHNGLDEKVEWPGDEKSAEDVWC